MEVLLLAHEQTVRFFDMEPLQAGIVKNVVEKVDYNPPEEKSRSLEEANAYIGRYKLVERMGEGGFGVVYLAEQEEPVWRKVALKIIRLGMDTERVISRFEMERQALAMMNHPHIAQVLDAGATETGRPYFVMELVLGVRITEYCDQHKLDIGKRIELFIQVCMAIQHAHQKGIIHRDIKPSNVLVTLHDEVATPKVIDFGIAKAIEGHLVKEGTAILQEQLIGTPAYMSPEQAETGGRDVDTRSDIYSLGALLHTLLVGRPAFDADQLQELSVEKIRRLVSEHQPLPPSKALLSLAPEELAKVAANRNCEPARLIRLLRGDLDWIVAKAMERNRQRRYATVNGLAIDLQRFLRCEPVSARPPNRLYQFQMLVRRNWVAFMAGLAVAAALMIGFGVSTWLYLREREARREQAQLLALAQQSEILTHAAFSVRDGKNEEANNLLKQIVKPPERPSLDGVSAFRAIGDWLALQERWKEAARCYVNLIHLDQLDQWGSVTLDYQACAVLLMETGDLSAYAQFCRTTAERYAGETNGDAAGRILKSCLLRPPDADLNSALQPLGKTAERWFARNASNQWAAIPVSLWYYRCGDYKAAAQFALSKEGQSDLSAATATGCAILGMALFHEGRVEEARENLARARKIVETGFATRWGATGSLGSWYDWVFARILLREAEHSFQRI